MGYAGLLQEGRRLVRSVFAEPSREAALRALAPPPGAREEPTPLLTRAAEHLARYLDDSPKLPAPDWLHYDEDFTGRVYRALAEVRPGTVVTYGELAARAGVPGAYRAVGRAVARNALAPFIPCHRVIRGDGWIGEYSAPGGTRLKRLLLEREGVTVDTMNRVRF